MKDRTNSRVKVLRQDWAGQAPEMAKRPRFRTDWSKEEQYEKGQIGDRWPNHMGPCRTL